MESISPLISAPFLYHLYVAPAPPFVGVAVKVISVPAQTATEGDAAIVTLIVFIGLTVTVAVPVILFKPVGAV